MAPRNNNLPPNHVKGAAAEDASIIEETNEPEVAAEEAWAAAEGYTPLADMRSDGAVFMAFNPGDDEENDGTEFSGAFFADVTCFGGPFVETPADEWDDDHECFEEVTEEAVADTDSDFRAMANQALQSLDEEYSMALSGTALPVSTEEQVGSNQKIAAIVLAKTSFPTPRFKDDSSKAKIAFNRPTNNPDNETPPIDTEAVRKAVDAIRLRAPRLTSNLNKWEEQHGVCNTSTMALAPREHSIIPKAPLSAFWRHSPKATAATANLSRSATLAEAILRLSCLSSQRERLALDIVGADHVECGCHDQVQTTFAPLIRWIGAQENSPQHIDVRLVGPNVPTEAAKRPPVDLMPAKAFNRLVSATATCYESVYHKWIQQEEKESKDFCRPDVAIAFNSGIWGYDEWLPTMQALCESSWSTPFVSTAYTIEECEDDADVIEKAMSSSTGSSSNIWKAEANPFGSRKIRVTATAASGREYRENASWQAWRLGGVSNN